MGIICKGSEEMKRIVWQHWLIDFANLDKSICSNGEAWIRAFKESAESVGLEVISTYSHTFEPPKPSGITAYVVLDSSHFSVHTYADRGEAAVDLFACTENDLTRAFSVVCAILGIRENNISMIKRVKRFRNGSSRKSAGTG